MFSATAISHLGPVSEAQLQQLTQVLWSWSLCQNCLDGKQCADPDCPWQRRKRLERFFVSYKQLTASYEPDPGARRRPAIENHEDLFSIIRELRSDPDITRAQLAEKIFHPESSQAPSVADQEAAISLAVRVMTMINCTGGNQCFDLVENGAYEIHWRADVPFSQFISDIFPMTDHPSLNDTASLLNMKTELNANKLKKHAGLDFRPTDDLRRHLKFDRKNFVVEIYHHTSFLKEHLRITKDAPRDLSISDSLKMGALPRQLVLEALDSTQKILFPLTDLKSYTFLQSLTGRSSFDPDVLRFESSNIRNRHEINIAYHYFGSRLAELYEELEHPQPKSWMERWLERKSGARHVMMVTLAGVVIAIVLGFMSLVVTIYQTWISYQQWKHPVST